jgi:hypothetical protein
MFRFTNVDYELTKSQPIDAYQTHPLLSLQQALDPILSYIDGLNQFIQEAIISCHFPSEDGLTRDESAAIYLYTMDWGHESLYRVLNEALREKDRFLLTLWHGYLKLLDTAVQKLPSKQLEVWCGINLDISKNYKKR